MPRRPTRTVPTVIVHGINGSPADHWQRWLATELSAAEREVRFPELPNPDAPDLVEWKAALATSLADLQDDGFDVVAHSLGAALWLHHAVETADSPRPARVALVALPASSVLVDVAPSFTPIPLDIDSIRRAADGTVLVGGDDDPYCPGGIARVYGAPLKMAVTVIPGGGHLNVDAGYGPWPAVLDWCGRDNLAFIA
ncbi:alpha/beta hydrolase [Jatrophihabitans telluris]|uniref:Alpha/beta hydrolase n=1 Tax=Jatrophihabitans telluris TaxID=2038343 RepID=A0ABY4QX80_9ACTN|nr:alpha/beta hydrolase [Jatrophihabitans telluris]UQX87928.1 alpha/beta hydrolase [Jatrophihabitans telluris]